MNEYTNSDANITGTWMLLVTDLSEDSISGSISSRMFYWILTKNCILCFSYNQLMCWTRITNSVFLFKESTATTNSYCKSTAWRRAIGQDQKYTNKWQKSPLSMMCLFYRWKLISLSFLGLNNTEAILLIMLEG